jgi:hypothetical protein
MSDAAFANPAPMTLLETESYCYAIRINANAVLEREIEYLLKRHVGRPLQKFQGVLPQLPIPGKVLASPSPRYVTAVAIPTFPTRSRPP